VGRGIAVHLRRRIRNLFFQSASELKAIAHDIDRTREFMMAGIPGIAEGMNQKLTKIELEACLEKTPASKKGKRAQRLPASPRRRRADGPQ
jgi:hypothetical protein